MAPFYRLIKLPNFIIPRASTDEIATRGETGITTTSFSDSQLAILQAASLTISTVSLLAGFFTFYWFMRMRRSFRHDLIMLLIVCDMWKALWYMLFPIVEFFEGQPVQSESNFCQASGFFLAIGTEACDVVILMIAIHTALYIFRSRHSESGLYPYRRPAYAALIFLPIIMASLAFVGGSGYVNVGEHCYLPIRPDVYRLTLSWVPRYFIFIVILTIYASLYIYIRMLMRRYAKASGTHHPIQSISLKSEGLQHSESDRTVPPRPPTAYRGLVSPPEPRWGTARPLVRSWTDNERPRTVDSTQDIKTDLQKKPLRNSMLWKWPVHIDTANRPHPLASNPTFPPSKPNSPGSPSSDTTTQTTHPRPAYTPGASEPENLGEINTPPSSWIRRTPTNPSVTCNPLLKVLSFATGEGNPCAFRPDTNSDIPSRSSSTSHNDSHPPLFSDDVTGMAEARDRISRQLRMLFVYPLVYMIMWVIPFVSHILTYSNHFAGMANHPFPLLVFSLVSLTAQGAVDCWLFASREQPWRHAREGFWEAMRKKFMPKTIENGGNVKRGVGRSREEMMVDGRNARIRRDEEIAERKQEMGKATADGRNKEWWEVGVGGGTTRWSQMPLPKPRRPSHCVTDFAMCDELVDVSHSDVNTQH
ncbi:plasma membrane G-protein coupled receptor [Zalerion maritima]|uniref:Plasma membrane G-protein coupled receptor n=1 Tax=Zalerion maritima TaxID=339359 RepID=A0AAD5RS13_9PEZI|nr:plasma membrane G-protein coupled receptor [Zalerion maritima]